MRHALILIAALALAGCAASPAAQGGQNANLGFALGQDLTCDAGDMVSSPAGGGPEETMTIYISLLVPDRGGAGRFCIATGCEDAHFAPTMTRALGWTAVMTTTDRTHYSAELEIARDLRTFTLRQADSHGVRTWAGTCSAAGS